MDRASIGLEDIKAYRQALTPFIQQVLNDVCKAHLNRILK